MVSIAMATYNGSRFICEQLDSILSQTISDFELIVCDDFSTDNTYEILQEYVKRDPRIRIYRNNINLGFTKNFEKAISLCKGDYIALCDQDDIWIENHIEILLNNIGNYPMCCGNSLLVDKNGKSLNMSLRYQEALDNIPENDISKVKSILYFRNAYQGSTMLLSRNFLKLALPIPDGIKYHDTWFASLACFCGGFNYVDSIINYYRMHGSNASGTRIKRKSKVRSWVSIGIKGLCKDRYPIIKAIMERIPIMDDSEKTFLIESIQRFSNVNGINQKVNNWFYITLNYKSVFSSK